MLHPSGGSQRDFTPQLCLSGTSQRVVSAARQMGITICRTGICDSRKKNESNMDKVNSAIQEAPDSGHLIVCIIDDYYHYHAIRWPGNSAKTSCVGMYKTVIRILPCIPAIKNLHFIELTLKWTGDIEKAVNNLFDMKLTNCMKQNKSFFTRGLASTTFPSEYNIPYNIP